MKHLLLICLLWTSLGYSSVIETLKDFKSLNLQLGTWLENYGQVRDSRSDDENGFELNPYFGIGLEYHLPYNLSLAPELGYVLQRTEGEISKNQFLSRLDLIYLVHEKIKLRFGTSYMITSISGDGGEDTLNNGDSTEVYYIPEARRNSFDQTIDLGIEFIFEDIHLRAQAHFFELLDEEQRMRNYNLSINYQIPKSEL